MDHIIVQERWTKTAGWRQIGGGSWEPIDLSPYGHRIPFVLLSKIVITKGEQMELITLKATVIGRAYADIHKDEKGDPAKLSALENVRMTLQVPAITPSEIAFVIPVLGVDEMKQGSEVVITIAPVVDETVVEESRTKKKK